MQLLYMMLFYLAKKDKFFLVSILLLCTEFHETTFRLILVQNVKNLFHFYTFTWTLN